MDQRTKMRDLKPVKVTIGLKADGSAAYPDFNQLEAVQAAGTDWAKYIDIHGLGWQYDKSSGHQDDTEASPVGQQFGVLIVDKVFADQAIAKFPETCVALDETQLEDYYDNCAHAHEQDEIINEKIVSGIAAKKALGLELTEDQTNALDITSEVKGINKNPNKKWADFKAKKGIKIVA